MIEIRTTIKIIMVIDDDAVDQILHKKSIDRSGLVTKLITFGSAEEAIGYLKSSQAEMVDIILLDINMPRMSGFDFLELVSTELDWPFTKAVVVMLSSLDVTGRKRANEYRIVKQIIEKPLKVTDIEEMSNILRTL